MAGDHQTSSLSLVLSIWRKHYFSLPFLCLLLVLFYIGGYALLFVLDGRFATNSVEISVRLQYRFLGIELLEFFLQSLVTFCALLIVASPRYSELPNLLKFFFRVALIIVFAKVIFFIPHTFSIWLGQWHWGLYFLLFYLFLPFSGVLGWATDNKREIVQYDLIAWTSSKRKAPDIFFVWLLLLVIFALLYSFL